MPELCSIVLIRQHVGRRAAMRPGYAMRVYCDNNVFAHAQEAGQSAELVCWFRAHGHLAVLSEVSLSEALAIKDEGARRTRLSLLRALPWRQTDPLGSLHAREFVGEVRRLRPHWRRLPIGDQSLVAALLAAHRNGWRQLRRGNFARLEREISAYREVEEPAIRRSRAAQAAVQHNLRGGFDQIMELTLGDQTIPRQVDLHDPQSGWRLQSLFAWWGALHERQLTLSDYANYADPFVRVEAAKPAEVAEFWLDEVDLERMVRTAATGLIEFAQLDQRVGHGNPADARHAGYLVDADVFVTEDQRFAQGLELLRDFLPGVAFVVVVRRNEDLVGQLAAAVS